MLSPAADTRSSAWPQRGGNTPSRRNPRLFLLTQLNRFRHGMQAALTLTQSIQILVDLGHLKHLHHRFDAMARTEIEHSCNRGRRARGGN